MDRREPENSELPGAKWSAKEAITESSEGEWAEPPYLPTYLGRGASFIDGGKSDRVSHLILLLLVNTWTSVCTLLMAASSRSLALSEEKRRSSHKEMVLGILGERQSSLLCDWPACTFKQ